MWNDKSSERTSGVDPRLIEILTLARQRTGIPFEVSEGMRTTERQKKMVAQGKSQTMNSKHLHGNAVDIHISDGNGGVNWDFDAYRPIADAAKAAAEELGYTDFVWGGDWKTLKDGVHFQVGGNHKGPAAPASGGAQPASDTYTPGNYVDVAQVDPEQPVNALSQSTPQRQPQNALSEPRPFQIQGANQLALGGFAPASNPFLSYLRNA